MWIIITTDSVYIPGDERSRTHPGHGYPASYDNIDRVEKFTDDQYTGFIDRIKRLIRDGKSYTAYKAEQVTVKQTIEIEVT